LKAWWWRGVPKPEMHLSHNRISARGADLLLVEVFLQPRLLIKMIKSSGLEGLGFELEGSFEGSGFRIQGVGIRVGG